MNILDATISQTTPYGELLCVRAQTEEASFAILAVAPLELPQQVRLLFKETDVLLAHKDSILLTPNAFISPIHAITKGELLWQVSLGFLGGEVVALVLAENAQHQNLECQNEILWSIKPTEITIQSRDE